MQAERKKKLEQPKTEEEIWAEYYATPITPEGLQRRLELLDMIQPPTTPETEEKQPVKQPRKTHEDDEEISSNTAADEPRQYYHGHSRTELARLLKLREAGIVIDLAWHNNDPASAASASRSQSNAARYRRTTDPSCVIHDIACILFHPVIILIVVAVLWQECAKLFAPAASPDDQPLGVLECDSERCDICAASAND
jgi:hypothetical protein